MTDIWMMIVIAVGLVMDCFAVSLGIGASPSPCTPRSIFRLSFHFGLFQGGMTLLGGSRLGRRFGKNMEVLGGLVLIGIGLRIVITH